MYQPIERRKVYELIADRLLWQISERSLKPGDSLPTERELTQAYAVGRSSVREALRILESKGVIKASGKGIFLVADYDNPLSSSLKFLLTVEETSLRDLYEVRKTLEVEAAGLAAARRTDEDLTRMAAAIEGMISGLSYQNRYIEADLQFHLAVAAATRNRVALAMMHAIRDSLHRALASVYHIPGSAQRSISQHQAILKEITAAGPDAARQRMREHLLRVEGDIEEALGGSRVRPREREASLPAGDPPAGAARRGRGVSGSVKA